MREKRHHQHRHLPLVARSVEDESTRDISPLPSATPVTSQDTASRQSLEPIVTSSSHHVAVSTGFPTVAAPTNSSRFNYSSSGILNSDIASHPNYNLSLVAANFNASTSTAVVQPDIFSLNRSVGNVQGGSSTLPSDSSTTLMTTRSSSSTMTTDLITSVPAALQAATSNAIATPSAGVSATSGTTLSSTNKAVLGGVLGGLGGFGLMLAFALMLFSRSKRKRPESLAGTPQRMIRKRSSSRFATPVRGSMIAGSRTRKNSEPASPNNIRSFQVISGRRLSSPPDFHGQLGATGRTSISNDSSPRSNYTTPSRRSRLGGTSTVFRTSHLQDDLGRSHDNGSTISHVSRFVERLDDT